MALSTPGLIVAGYWPDRRRSPPIVSIDVTLLPVETMMKDTDVIGVSLLVSVALILVFASLWAFAGVRAHAQVPPFVAYPVSSGCLYVSAQGYMVLDHQGCR